LNDAQPEDAVTLSKTETATTRKTAIRSTASNAGAVMTLSSADAERLSSLIDTVYDAAIERAQWLDALQQACEFVNCSAGVVLSADLLGTFGISVNWGYDPRSWESYQTHYFNLDPLNRWVFQSQIGGVFVGSRSSVWPEMLASTYYHEWARPQGFVDLIGGTLDKTAFGVAALTCIRREEQGHVDDECAWRMSLILPHFRRALLISKLLDQHDLRAGAFAETMDALSTSVFFLDSAGGVVHANQSGREILSAGEPLRLIGRSLVAADQSFQTAFRQALNIALGDQTEGAPDAPAFSVEGSTGELYTTNFLPLTSGARRQVGLSTTAIAALFLRKTNIDVASAIAAATQLYGFTPSEARVLAEIIDQGGLGQIATRLGVSRRTVQTHLEHLFGKTGSKRQADLVKLVAGHQSPLRDRD
jgi:DNA-binding CsgD family transcriptional regulator/PAS domain-containing protein